MRRSKQATLREGEGEGEVARHHCTHITATAALELSQLAHTWNCCGGGRSNALVDVLWPSCMVG
jgi:hypothetical protein